MPSSTPREFSVSCELYLVPSNGASSRKTTPRKKSEGKLDFLRGLGGSEDKLKDKLTNTALANLDIDLGVWKSATCKFSGEGPGPVLNIYSNDNVLYQTVFVHLLKQTDIRCVDRSILFRSDCLGIYAIATHTSGSHPTGSPLFLAFPSGTLRSAWSSLLRAFAQPEVYGASLAPAEGGLYRMWRELEVDVVESRGTLAGAAAIEAVFVEVVIDGVFSARTSGQRGRTWQERFTFGDLPPARSAEIRLCVSRKGAPYTLGRVDLDLNSLRRGEPTERWHPVVLAEEPAEHDKAQPVELRLRVRLDEEIVLPHAAYAHLLETLTSRNLLEWQRDFESKLPQQANTLRHHLAGLWSGRRMLVENLIDGARRELDALSSAANSNVLFRGNTPFTKNMELVLAKLGSSFVHQALGPTIRRACAQRLAIEVDPTRGPSGGAPRALDLREIDRNATLLASWVSDIWDGIYAARGEFPYDLRRLLQHIRLLVEQRRSPDDPSGDASKESAWQSVSAFVFLRCLVPAILRPHSFGIIPGLPDPAVSRSLMLIGKVVQGLANLNTHVDRAEHMRPVKDFLSTHLSSMIDFLLEVSSPLAPTASAAATPSDITTALKRRQAALPTLHRDAAPRAPDSTDVPRHLALIASVVVAHTRGAEPAVAASPLPGAPAVPPTPLLDSLIGRCQEIEARALRRVARLAAPPALGKRPTSAGSSRPPSSGKGSRTDNSLVPFDVPRQRATTAVPDSQLQRGELTPITADPATVETPTRTRKISYPATPKRKSTRPSTAPTHSAPAVPFSAGRGVLANNPAAANSNYQPPVAAIPALTLDTTLDTTGAPFKSTLQSTMEFSPQLKVAALTPISGDVRGGWTRRSEPTLDIPDGLRPPKAPFTIAMQPTSSTDSLPSLARTKSSDVTSRADSEPRKKKLGGFLRILKF